MLRKHQTQLQKIARQIASGKKRITDILVYVVPGGGKSAIASILAAELPGYQIVWVVPRLTLRDQGARDFGNPELQILFGQSGELREADNQDQDNLTRGTRGYVTTYQSVVADTALHVREVGRQKTILILDETHHAPEQARRDKKLAPFFDAVRALAAKAAIRVYASGTLTRHDGRRVAFIPHLRTDQVWEYVNFKPQANWAKISYTRATAIQEKAIHDITVQLFDGRVQYTVKRKNREEQEVEFQSLKDVPAAEHSHALYAALRSPLAYQIIDAAIEHWRAHKQEYPAAKLLVIAPQINVAQEYHKYINGTYGLSARIATSDDGPEAQTAILHFKGVASPETDVLVTVGMAYEGLDVRQITHVVLLTHIRSVPWLNQAISRANRVEPTGKKKQGFVYCPADKPLVDALRLIDYVPAVQRAEWAEGVEGAGGVVRGTVSNFDGNTTTSSAMSLDGKIYIYPGELRKIQQLARAAGQAGADPIFVKLILKMGGAPTQDGEVVITQPVLKQQEKKLRQALHQAIVTRCTSRNEATQRRRLAKYNRRVEEKYGPRPQMTADQLEAALNDVINNRLFEKEVA